MEILKKRSGKLKVLQLEDSSRDAEIMRELLKEAGFDLEIDCTMTEKEFVSFLRCSTYDIILADFRLPGFDAFGALRHVMEICSAVPFICVSGTIGEESAVELLKQGAVDYVMKDRLARLPAAIKRALDEAKEKEERKRAEKSLAESELKYRDMVEQINDVIYSTDANGVFTYISPTVEILGGYKPEEMIGHSMGDFLDPLFLPKIKEQFKKIMAGIIESMEYRVKIKSGEYRWIRSSSRPILKENKSIGMRGVLTDITESKHVEDLLRLEYSRHKRFIDSNIVGVIIAAADGKIVETNDYYLNLIGYTRREFESGKVDWRAMTPTEWLPADEKAIRELRERGTCTPYEKEYRKKDGTRVPVFLADTLLPGPEEQIAAFVLDITDRKRAEEYLRKSEAQLRAVIDATRFPVALVDVSDNNIEYWSRSALTLFGHTAPTAEGWYRMAYPDPDYRREVIDRWKQSLEKAKLSTQAVNAGEYRVSCRDGSVRICELYAAFLADRLIVTFNDITERKLSEEMLKKSEAQYRLLAEHMKDTVWLMDMDLKTTYISPSVEKLRGYTLEELRQLQLEQQVAPASFQTAKNAFSEELSKVAADPAYNINRTLELEFYRKDGTTYWSENTYGLVRDEKGTPISILGEGRNITERKRAEEELRESEEKFATIFREASGSMGLHSYPDGKWIDVNDNFSMTTGYNREEVLGKTTSDLKMWVDPNARNRFLSLFQENESVQNFEVDLNTKSGVIKNGLLSAHAVTIHGRKYMVSTFNDITERKVMEEKLQESEERFRSLYENSTIGLYRTSPDGKIILGNPTLVKMLGYSSFEELAARNLEREGFEPSYERKKFIEQIELNEEVKGLESAWTHKDGSIIYIRESARAIRDANGRTLYYDGSVEDITERKLAENAFIRERNLLNALMDTIPDHIYFKDINSRFLRVNKSHAERFGLRDPKQAEGKTDFDFFTEEHARPAYEIEQEIIKTGLPVVGLEEKESWPDGQRTWVSTTKIPLYDNNGKITGTFGVSRDITAHKLMEEDLRKNEERFRKIFEESQLGVVTLTPEFRFEKVNPAFCSMLGYTEKELSSMGFADITHPDDVGKDFESLKKLGLGEIPFYKAEKRYLRKSGEVVWGNIVISCIRSTDGALLYHMGMIENITERKRKEQEISRLNRLYAVLSNINELIVREGDRQTLLNEVCNVAVREGGFQMSWIGIVDAETDSFQPVASAGKENGYLEHLHTSIVQIMAGREPLWMTLFDGQIVICNDIEHDDRLISLRDKTLALGYRSLAAFPLDVDDELIGVVNFYSSEKDFFNEEELELLKELAMDVSYALHSLELEDKRTQAEKETRESENKYSRIFENVQDVYYETSIDGTILEISPSIGTISKKQYSRNELIGKSINDFYLNAEERKDFLSAIQERGSVTDYEVMLKNRDGSHIPSSISAKLQFDAQGSPEKIIGSISDITERKLYQNQLMQTQKVQSIGTLAGGIAHDFNNILGIILAFTSVLERSEGDKEKISKSTAAITQAVNRGAALVRQILTFARQTGVSMKPMRIPDLIRELVAMLKETFPEVIEFQTSIGKNIPIINADQTQLHQVLLNLCVNARDAMPKGGTIGIEVKTIASETLVQQFPKVESGRYISVRVSDTGVGMDEATKSCIFDPFFTTKEKGKGTGLGLSVVHGVVEEHHGFISVDSKVGAGTTFYLYLPVPQDEKKIQNGEKVKTEAMQSGSETILFAEDEQLLREIVQSTLESMGYKVIVAANGKEAVDIYKKHFKSIGLVLTDVGLPKLLGTDVFAMMKEINPDVRVVFASGFMSLETKSELLRAGAKGFILKPYNLNEVLQIVREVLDEKEE